MDTTISTRKMVSMAMLIAISVVLVYFVHLPFPPAPFLEYDPADIPILIGAFVFGPSAGLLLTILASVIQGITVSSGSGWIGIVVHIFATGCCAVAAGSIYQKNPSMKQAAIALVVGALLQTAAMVVMNLIFTPLFMNQPLVTVLAMIVPIIIPFNLLKAGVNCLVTLLLYRSIGKAVRA